jgi:hypothetical protein
VNGALDRRFRGDFYQAVDQNVADSDVQRQYYVPIYELPDLRPHDVVNTMLDAIAFSTAESVQLLSGFRGSGKTSELLRLRDQLNVSGYRVVYFDIEDYFNTELPVNGGSFELALAAGFAENCSAVEPDVPFWRSFVDFLRRIEITVEVTIGPATIGAMLGDDESFRGQVARAIKSNRRAFRNELHAFMSAASQAMNSDVGTVFIVDSIDHFRGRTSRFSEVRESVESVFTEGAEDLCIPGLHVIYTIPMYVNPAVLGTRRDLLNIKVADQFGKPHEAGLAALRRLLGRRAPGGETARLLGTDLDHVISQSGGHIRSLLQLVGEIILAADSLPVTATEIGRAESIIRANMQRALSAEQLDLLKRVHASNELIPHASEWADAADLMSYGAILLYPNGEQPWYGVHPLLHPLVVT